MEHYTGILKSDTQTRRRGGITSSGDKEKRRRDLQKYRKISSAATDAVIQTIGAADRSL